MIYLLSFLIGGLICAIAQFLMDKFKLMPIFVTCLFVFLGALFSIGGLYQKGIDCFGFGLGLPISSFGASLTNSAIELSNKIGYIGIITGMFNNTSLGIVSVIIISLIISLLVKPKG